MVLRSADSGLLRPWLWVGPPTTQASGAASGGTSVVGRTRTSPSGASASPMACATRSVFPCSESKTTIVSMALAPDCARIVLPAVVQGECRKDRRHRPVPFCNRVWWMTDHPTRPAIPAGLAAGGVVAIARHINAAEVAAIAGAL